MTDEWKTQKFRQSVVTKINEAIQSSPMDPTKNGTLMENHVFKKARSREEYLSLVAKLILHVRGMTESKQQQQPQQGDVGAGVVNNVGMPDPINALQNLASQGSRNPQMMSMSNQNQQMPQGSVMGGNVAASNLLQTLTQQRPGQQIPNMQGIRNQMGVPMNPNMPQQNLGPNQMGQQMGNVMGNAQMNINMQQMQNQGNQLGVPNQMIPQNQMQMGQQMNAMGNVQQMPINQMNQGQMNMSMNHQQLNQMMGRMNQNQPMNVIPGGVNNPGMPSQMQVGPGGMNAQAQMGPTGVGVNPQTQVQMGQNPGQMNPSAAGNVHQMISIQNMQQKSQNIVVNNPQMFPANRQVGVSQNQFLRQSPSPAGVPSPAGGLGQPMSQQSMIPSPAMVSSSSPQMAGIMNNNQRNAMRQSPSAPLNTPGQVTGLSPFNPQEDQLYREKYKQLTKYIEPLNRMVAKVGNDEVEKIMKMNKLLEILNNPNQRIPLETLLKCEKALEKMDFKSCLFVPSANQFGTNNPLFEAVNATVQSPLGNHTLQRTFRPCMESLFGTDIRSLPTPAKQRRLSSDCEYSSTTEIPHVLQGEIARLDQKFKVSLDVSAQNNNKMIKLICFLDDKRLPCVPPVNVSIPEDYPFSSPSCSLSEHEYSATPFLVAVQDALMARISKLPKCHSLSHVLDTWEMSVRQACSPVAIAPTKISTLLGM